jgi:hypothetical protein
MAWLVVAIIALTGHIELAVIMTFFLMLMEWGL